MIKRLLAQPGEVLEHVRHMGVGDPAVLTGGTLLLRLGGVVHDHARRGGNVQTDIDERVAHVVWVGGDGDLVPVADELGIHAVHERGIVVPDGLGDAVLGLLQQDLLLRGHGLDLLGDVGPAVFEVFDGNALRRLLGLQVGLELRWVADGQLGLVVVQPRAVVEADAVVLAGGVEQLAQLLPVGLLLAHVEVLHDLLEVQLLQPVLQVVARKAKLRVDVVARAHVGGLRVDDVGRIDGPLALGAICGRVGGRGRRRGHAEERHGGGGGGQLEDSGRAAGG
jgi:hypothetical protein